MKEVLDLSKGDAQFALFPEDHRFLIPTGVPSEEVRSITANVGWARQKVLCSTQEAIIGEWPSPVGPSGAMSDLFQALEGAGARSWEKRKDERS